MLMELFIFRFQIKCELIQTNLNDDVDPVEIDDDVGFALPQVSGDQLRPAGHICLVTAALGHVHLVTEVTAAGPPGQPELEELRDGVGDGEDDHRDQEVAGLVAAPKN